MSNPGVREVLLRRSDPRDAEIEDLGHPVVQDEDVARLDVAMDDALLVGVREAVADLHHQRQLALEGHVPALGDDLLQLLAFQVLHDDEQAPLVLAQVVDRDDVGMAELRAGLGLAEEPRPQLIVMSTFSEMTLRATGASAGGRSPCNGAHASPPDLRLDLVLAQPFDHRPLDLFGVAAW